MSPDDSVDPQNFRRILTRNVARPLGVGLVGAALFVGLIFYLLNATNMVEHTDLVLRKANTMEKLSIDQETGMRGFLITGDENFLDPYEVAVPKLGAESASLKLLVGDNPPQVDRLQ